MQPLQNVTIIGTSSQKLSFSGMQNVFIYIFIQVNKLTLSVNCCVQLPTCWHNVLDLCSDISIKIWEWGIRICHVHLGKSQTSFQTDKSRNLLMMKRVPVRKAARRPNAACWHCTDLHIIDWQILGKLIPPASFKRGDCAVIIFLFNKICCFSFVIQHTL